MVGDGTKDPAQGFTITATAGEGGAITPSGRVAVANGGSQTFTVTADSGYSISDVTVDDSTAADVVQNDNGTYTVQNVTKDCTIHATFSKNSSSGGSSSSSTRYTVSVEDTDNGSVKVSPTRASRGTTVKPDEGYELDKLTVTGKDGDSIKLTDKGDGKYTFKMPASKVEVEAVFTAIETEPEQPESLPFTDVSSGEWYYDAVAYVYEKGLMDGTSAVTFDPGAVLTRAMTAQVLWNLAGSPAAPGGAGFTDVAADAWYAGAVNWAAVPLCGHTGAHRRPGRLCRQGRGQRLCGGRPVLGRGRGSADRKGRRPARPRRHRHPRRGGRHPHALCRKEALI